ncbi:hypothetical protein Hanom_Chr09g00780251 [Helianthus anomalus]
MGPYDWNFVKHLISNFCQKYMDGPYGLHFVPHLIPNFCQKYMDGPRGVHYVTHLVAKLDLLKPFDLLVGE